MKRRRFLTLSAAFACAPMSAQAETWTGRALGADVSVRLHGPREETRAALAALPRHLTRYEALFSLYDPRSSLSKLNSTGTGPPDVVFRDHLAQCHAAWRLTDGLFDPTVQPLWQALARGEDAEAARALIGWDRVRLSSDPSITLGPGQQLTLNGIAQGYMTELVAGWLRGRGFDRALINIGEYQAIGGPFSLGVSARKFGLISTFDLSDRAVATSSPGAMQIGDQGHILAPDGRPPLWSTVSIEAPGATMADALSTAAVFMEVTRLQRLKAEAGLHRITAIDAEGNIRTV